MKEEFRKVKTIKSAFDSPTFDTDVSFHVDRKVGAASISPSGRDVVLASTDGLDIIDLDSPLNPPRHLRHGLPWLVADVQWSPFAVRDYWVVSTANQKALVWNLNMQDDVSGGAIEHTLQGHYRAITDINFSAHHPDMLATCAVDGYVHCWDLRRPRQPAITFCDWFAGATQVKYNRQDSHILASSHDRWLRIWDDRNGAAPLKSIDAHESKIYGVDWNRTRTTGVITCSLDKSIKIWDYSNDIDEPERIIRTDFPVWRARHTPFGWGILAMPQDAPGDLYLYDRRSTPETSKDFATPPVVTFSGHGNHKVKEFLWRSRGSITDNGIDNREFQLVSWGQDKQLRLQHVDPRILETVGYIKGGPASKNLNFTRKGAAYRTFRHIEGLGSDKKAATITGPRPGSSGFKVSALTAGVRKMSLPSSTRTYMMARASSMKTKDKKSRPEEESQKQIGWMSGIKFTKQDNGPGQRKRSHGRRLSLLNPDFEEDGDWDGPESLHDEIIRVSKQLPKVAFESIDMDKKTIVVSMNGPWGEESSPIYIRVTITFPEQYPETKAPSLTIGKTSLMPDATYNRLKQEVQQIAAGFVSRKKGCLEAALCYLLGEVDLETSVTFFKDGEDLDDDDDLDGLADESSSDDDDVNIPAGASAMMSQELDASATADMLTPAHRNANVPLPRFCGARFTGDGRLVCFFPPKEEKVKSLLGALIDNNKERSKSDPVFETFGRLHNNSSPIPRNKSMSITEESRAESELSDDSDVSSSSDSDSSHFHVPRFPMADYWRRPHHRSYVKTSTIQSQKSSANGTGTGTGTGTGVSRSRSSKPKNIIALHDISYLLPSKKELAEEYAIFGEGPSVCENNAQVAEKYGFNDRADIWRYVAILLRNDVPLEVLDRSEQLGEPLLVIAKDAVKRYRRNSGSDSGVDLTYDTKKRRNSLSARVKWGTSPLARPLIADLFSHYERLADIQMLAMLSCIFSEPVAADSVSHAELRMTQTQTPLSMKTPAFSLDYFPTHAAAWISYQKTPVDSIVSTPRISQTPVGLYGSVGSSNGAYGSDPTSASYSCGETPPTQLNQTSSDQIREAQSLSTSPEGTRNTRRINQGIASSFAASFGRPFTMASSSPPQRKRPSPVEMLNSLAPSAITWGNTTVLGSVKESDISGRTSISEDESEITDQKSAICTGITIKMENQNVFDEEGCMNLPLLDPSKAALYESYRRTYAEMLYIWGHPLARLEILKFNGLKDGLLEPETPGLKPFAASVRSNDTHADAPPPSPIILGKKDTTLSNLSALEHGLDVTGYCLVHDTRLEPLPLSLGGGAIGYCDRCKHEQKQLRCTICLEPISALFPPCLSCGCANHQHCLREYHAQGGEFCPGGCECDCTLKASQGVVESWEVMMGAIEMMRILDAKRIMEEKERLTDWEAAEKGEWENLTAPNGGLGKGYSTLSKRLVQVRSGDWGIPGTRKKTRSLRKEER
ncbi:hypothetical protein F5884DRAFT_672600 [Xylogone sp. PMI_703]|nr:hypothetical protein F5884DRAFT_672600 [Xylogone sp. PMI_703]